MDDKQIRVGVAGLGRIGWNFHCRKLAEHSSFELAAVADPDPARLEEAEQTHGCQAFATFEAMLAGSDLDAVVIATPTHLHLDMALAACAKGLHILMEKPMAPSHEEGMRIAKAAQAAGVVLTVYQPHRHNAYFQHLKALIDSGVIGDVTWVHRASFNYARRNDWQALQKYGGGMLNNYGAHFLDQVLQLVGYDVKRVFCNLQIVASLGDADDTVKIILETNSGRLGECTINQASTINPFEFIVWGTCGGITCSAREIKLRYFDPESLPEKGLDTRLGSENRKYPSDQIDYIEKTISVDPSYQVDVFENLAQAIRTDSPVAVPPDETLALMKLTDQLRRDSDGIRMMRPE
ncbi:MAG: Gfo/Idh/MocA family oxidoreductase [Lentisphaeria bacterium]|nr:Gfo/Idh/MocA family oxidoreductase [Lentisphaeria bacterium]